MDIKDIVTALCEKEGVSGSEDAVARAVMELYRPFVDEVWIDISGSVIAVKRCGKPNAKRLMLDAHIDEIGLMVTEIDEKGFLRFCSIGGVDERILPACEVIVHGRRDLSGIISVKPPHIQTDEEMKQSLKIEDLAIDVGLDTQAASELVAVGDSVTFFRRPFSLSGGQFTAKSLDNRASVAALIYAAKQLSDKQLDIDVYFVSSVQEETGLAGATTAAYKIDPTCALVIDVTHGITPDNSQDAFEVGEGPAVSMGPNVSFVLCEMLTKIAKEAGISLHPEVSGGNTGTNAWAVQISRTGIAVAVISIPLKYMHTPVETASLNDIKAAGELAAMFASAASKRKDIWA